MDRLERLLKPKSIAVIGGGSWCENVILQAQKIGFSGAIYSVHPEREKIANVNCFKSVNDLPEKPDACFVGVNRNATIDTVRALCKKDAGGVICFASGFLESKNEDDIGAALQEELLAVAGDMPLIGPNCYGFVNYLDKVALWPDEHGGVPVQSGVAIVTQSSNIAINLSMQKRGLPVAYLLTAGNQAQTGLSEIALQVLEDPRVTALGLHIEGLDSVEDFQNLSRRAHALGKPVVVLKVGKSQSAIKAAVSHTASLAGSHTGATALLKRLGVAQVSSLPSLIEALKIAHVVGPLSSSNIASMSCSGGEASLMADTALEHKVEFPALSNSQRNELQNQLGHMVSLSNPLDYHTYIWGDFERMAGTFAAMLEGDVSFGMVVLDIPRIDRCDPTAWTEVIPAIKSAQKLAKKPIGVLASFPENLPEGIATSLIEEGIVPLCGIDEALCAIGALGNVGEPSNIQIALADQPGSVELLSEFDAKTLLSAAGVSVPQNTSSDSPSKAASAAESIGFPVALKGVGLAHKSENDAVQINLKTKGEVLEKAKAMKLDAFLIEEMIPDAIAEMLIGVLLDPAHGYLLTLGTGGTTSELLNDSATILMPATQSDVVNALESLRIYPILVGYRGKPGIKLSALVDLVLKVQNYVLANIGMIAELEINPVICTETRAVAVDALIRKGKKND